MTRGNIKLENPERFSEHYRISQEKLDLAIEKACEKLLKYDWYKSAFPNKRCYTIYEPGENEGWLTGLHTGNYILAYQLTGDEDFLNIAKEHIILHKNRLVNNIDMDNHDVGFVFSPSCVALYKVAGDEEAKNIAMGATKHFYDVSYSQKGGFILRCANKLPWEGACRTMMDTLMNAPLLFWAGEENNIQEYTDAAYSQNMITCNYLIREDGSSYHHYQFDLDTHAPLYGVTFQGNRDESTWSRGHAWGVYGFAIAYDYIRDEKLKAVQRDVTTFMLNHLPDDNVPYWDYDFISGNEPRDTSAGVISACGMLEMIKFLPENSVEKEIYQNAAHKMIDAVIDKYTGEFTKDGKSYDGLFWGVTGAKPLNLCIEECALYGDYFYLEALLRLKNPQFKRHW